MIEAALRFSFEQSTGILEQLAVPGDGISAAHPRWARDQTTWVSRRTPFIQ
jgi:hypothetical protein